jgi:hypothetical protein
MPAKEEMPSTLQRSSKKARDTWGKAHDNAVKEYGEGERSHRTAFAALKHSFEKVGDHWEPKKQRGPSDSRSKQPTRAARAGRGKTFGGVNVEGHTRDELVKMARRLRVTGVTRMTKEELGEAIDRANQRQTEKARQQKKT